MKEEDTYKKVAIPMTDKQAHEAFACKTCKGFDGALQYLKGFMDDVFTNWLIDGYPVSTKDHKEYHKHLDLVANPDCDGQCVSGETMSLSCPHCKVDDSADRIRREVQGERSNSVNFNWYCYLPTKYICPYCKGRVVLEGHSLSIVQNHNAMKGDVDRSNALKGDVDYVDYKGKPQMAHAVRGFGVPIPTEDEDKS